MSNKIDRNDSLAFSEGEFQDVPYRQNFEDSITEEEKRDLMIQTSEEERSERLVVRLVPKAIDYAIFAIQLTILGSYFYVAYIWEGLKKGQETTCIADINSDVPLSEDSN